jgi:SAM-dependent methyltransferase
VNYPEVTESLRRAYAGSARKRDAMRKEPWKVAERQTFLERLRAERLTRLLEVGAGPGHDSVFFTEQGIDVVTTDLTPEMVELCRAKGLDAHVMDLLVLDFPDGSFDAAWAMNCLLHVPDADLPSALAEVRRVLRPDGLFFLGVYGNDVPEEGINPNDWHDPPRFFSFRTDDQIQTFAAEHFDVVDFHTFATGERFRHQSLTLRKPS